MKKIVRIGLMGKDVSKSQSQAIHSFILENWGMVCCYEKFSIPPSEFDNAIRCLLGDFDGFNVTIPYKRDVMEYLNGVEGDAMLFSAVNTVVSADALGYNTDGEGFMQMLQEENVTLAGKKVLVLGAGGSGRSVAVKLKQNGAEVFLYQRRREKLLETCAEIGVQPAENAELGGFDILVNCTGVGTLDTEGKSPVTENAFKGATIAIELIYTPAETEFMRLAKQQGLKTFNGGAMLFYQAYYADCLIVDKTPDIEEMHNLYAKYLQTIHQR